tara:strand:+ start:509 stop:784 length:276 start_codon:yes stop_codon:yes gene_type:complete
MTELKIGDRVMVVDQCITGKIVSINHAYASILDDDREDDGTLEFRISELRKTITVMIKADFDPTLGADIVEAVEDFEQLLCWGGHFGEVAQ